MSRGQLAPMYRRLPHGPNGMGREEVRRNQRTRIYGGMIESVSQRGYQGTAVAHVIALAGVSRRAFYEQFSNKEECFLSTYDIVVARARKQVLDAWSTERGWSNRLHAACKALLDEAASDPKGPRMVLVDSLGVGSSVRERMHLAGHAFERLIVSAFRVSPDGVDFPPLASRGIVGGVRHVLFVRMVDRREQELYNLADEVLDWIESYRTPAARRLGVIGHGRSSRVPLVPAEFLLRDDRRARMLSSVVHLTLDQGYAELSDPQIAQFAGHSTEAFHKQFANKQECYLAVLDEFVNEAMEFVRATFERAISWPEAVYRAITAFVHYLASHQALLRIAFIHLFEVGPAVIGRMTQSVECFTAMLLERAPTPRLAPEVTPEAVTGALWSMISAFAGNDRVTRLPSLVDHLSFTTLAPYIGAKEAVEAIEACRRPLRAV
jgi:AcrR family transcriptional regulator